MRNPTFLIVPQYHINSFYIFYNLLYKDSIIYIFSQQQVAPNTYLTIQGIEFIDIIVIFNNVATVTKMQFLINFEVVVMNILKQQIDKQLKKSSTL